MMGRRVSFYAKTVCAQCIAYLISMYLVNVVFLGSVPIIRPSFVKSVQGTPQHVASLFSSGGSFIASFVRQQPKSSDANSQNLPTSGGFIFGSPYPTKQIVPTLSQGQSRFPERDGHDNTSPTSAPPTQPPFRHTILTPTVQPPIPSRQQDNSSPSFSQIESGVISYINEIRRQKGLGELTSNTQLTNAAKKHVADITKNNPHASTNPHYGTNGSTPPQRASREGYRGGVGEVIAFTLQDAHVAVDAWMGSPGHRATIMISSGRHVGVAWSAVYGVVMVGY